MLCQKMIWGGIVALALCLGSNPLTASITYPDLTGSTVTYENITESSATDPVPLYGQPSISGDTLVFSPEVEFAASAPKVIGNTAVNADVTDGRLKFTVRANQGLFINTITLSEFGDYVASGLSDTQVTASGAIFASFFNGTQQVSVAFDGYDPDPDTGGDSPFFANSSGVWLAEAFLNLSEYELTEVDIIINNTLTAVAPNSNGAAFIAKKGFNVEVTAIPEPASMALFGVGTLLIIARRRRRCIVHQN